MSNYEKDMFFPCVFPSAFHAGCRCRAGQQASLKCRSVAVLFNPKCNFKNVLLEMRAALFIRVTLLLLAILERNHTPMRSVHQDHPPCAKARRGAVSSRMAL